MRSLLVILFGSNNHRKFILHRISRPPIYTENMAMVILKGDDGDGNDGDGDS